MSISTATEGLASRRRVQPRHLVGALVLAIGLIAIVVAIAISSTTSSTGRQTTRPATISATRSHPPAQPTGVSDTNLAGGPFHDPVTHALLPGTPPAPQAEPGPGHR